MAKSCEQLLSEIEEQLGVRSVVEVQLVLVLPRLVAVHEAPRLVAVHEAPRLVVAHKVPQPVAERIPELDILLRVAGAIQVAAKQ